MNWNAKTRGLIMLSATALGVTTSALAALLRYTRQEIQRRGYPSWEDCRCDFKSQNTIFQVWYGQHKQQGETIISQEWGLYLVRPPQWLRRLLHHSTQFIAALKPYGRYLERVTLSPQESYQFASILHARTINEDLPDELPDERSYVTWRREVLHFPRYLFDAFLRRLYPTHIAPDKFAEADGLPALWDSVSDLPLPTEGTLLEVPEGTRIDCIGWSPSQISYCTARLTPQPA